MLLRSSQEGKNNLLYLLERCACKQAWAFQATLFVLAVEIQEFAHDHVQNVI